MNLVFLNSFQREGGEGVRCEAQVTIAEEHGQWTVSWSERASDGRGGAEIWYTGTAWNDMLGQFRLQVKEKLASGFRPLIEMKAERPGPVSSKLRFVRKLECYAEQNADPELYEQLRRWRNSQASSEKKSPYFVASNRQLQMISAFLPQTAEELRQIPGFGDHKTRMYSEAVFKLTAGRKRETAFPLDWVEFAVGDAALEEWWDKREAERLKGEAEKKEAERKLLSSIAEGAGIADLETLTGLRRREIVSRLEQLQREGCDLVPLLETELAGVPQHLLDQAYSLFRSDGDRYLKPVLQRLYGANMPEDKELSRAYEWLRLARIRFRISQAEAESAETDVPLARERSA
jgi:hypothetical protein